MSLRRLAISGAGVLLLGLSALGVPAAHAASATPATGPALACQSNLNFAFDTGQAVPTQRFGPALPSLNSIGGSNFIVPAGGSCTVNYVIVYGRLAGPGPVPRVSVLIKNDGTTPGGMHKPTGPNLAPGNTNLVPTALTSPSGYYDMQANLAAPVTVTAPPANAVRYWVVFQVRMNQTFGRWSWEVTQPDPTGEGDVWRNVPGGYGCGSGWLPVSAACLGGAPGKGLMMEVGT